MPKSLEVTVPTSIRRYRDIVRHTSKLKKDEVTRVRNILVTTPARTLLDLAAVLETKRELESAFEHAHQRNLAYRTQLATLLERYPRRPGVPLIREILEEAAIGTTLTASEREELLIALLDRHGIPRGLFNHRIELEDGTVFCPDCWWPELRLAVEVDSHTYHGSWLARRRDIERDAALAAERIWVLRVDGAALLKDPGPFADRLKRTIAHRERELGDYTPRAARSSR